MTNKPKTTKTATRRIYNLVPSKDQERDWNIDTALASGALRSAPLPPAVDLRATWWKVGNQETTGSCVGWATADGVMRPLLVAAGKLRQNEHLSPRFVWMASKETDEFTQRPESFIEESGTSLKAAADICRKYGMALEADLPFVVTSAMYLGNIDAFYAKCSTRRAANYFNAKKNMMEWKKAVAGGSPVLVGLTVDQRFSQGSSDGMLDQFDPGQTLGGHAVAIVGYRADGRFILRNSWDTTWGDRGFAYPSAEYIQACFFDESYVLTV